MQTPITRINIAERAARFEELGIEPDPNMYYSRSTPFIERPHACLLGCMGFDVFGDEVEAFSYDSRDMHQIITSRLHLSLAYVAGLDDGFSGRDTWEEWGVCGRDSYDDYWAGVEDGAAVRYLVLGVLGGEDDDGETE